MAKHWARKPRRPFMNWIVFITGPDAKAGLVEAVNYSGGICKGQQYQCWDFEGEYYAIWNQAGNAVWCHKNNLKLIDKGTVHKLQSKVI